MVKRNHPFFSWLLASLFAFAAFPVSAGFGLDTPAKVAHAAPQIAEQFADYYNKHEGMRVLGYPMSDLLQAYGYPAQYFEKGRIEDHRGEITNPNWAFMYGRLLPEMAERNPQGYVSTTAITYADLMTYNAPDRRTLVPDGFKGGTISVKDGTFVPYDPNLKAAPGYVVPPYFWAYINRADLFPGGWLHDIGLPMTPVVSTTVQKNGQTRAIVLQGFERTVLSSDPANPAEWQVERGNIGADAFRTVPAPRTDMTPEETASAFYDWYIHYPANALASGAYKSSPYLSAAFITKVEKIVAGFTGGGYDPIICAQDVPSLINPGKPEVKGGEARIRMLSNFPDHSFTVVLRQVSGVWKIDDVECGGSATPAGVELPREGQKVMLPIHIVARLGQPGEKVTASLRWQDSTLLVGTFTLLKGSDGAGLLVANLDWENALNPPVPKTQAATLELKDSVGRVLGSRALMVVSPNDPATQEIKLYWTVSGNDEIVTPQTRRVLKTDGIAAAALEELLWGPPAVSQVGFRTAIPTPEQVLAFPGRDSTWGNRVRLLGVSIKDGVATADFSREMNAYGGGSLRVKMIRDQITQTLKQFAGVREVRIAVEGDVETALQP